MTFKPNKAGIDKVFAEIAAKIEGVDKGLRDEYTGGDVDEIVAAAASRFSAAGVHFTGVELRDYAESVRDNKPFQIKIQ